MVIRRLKPITLKKANKIINTTGNKINVSYELIDNYKVQTQILQDQLSATIYGTNINKMKRIASPLHKLEKYLLPKVENKEDNISLYYIFIDSTQYKIIAVREYYIDIERL